MKYFHIEKAQPFSIVLLHVHDNEVYCDCLNYSDNCKSDTEFPIVLFMVEYLHSEVCPYSAERHRRKKERFFFYSSFVFYRFSFVYTELNECHKVYEEYVCEKYFFHLSFVNVFRIFFKHF